jgi:hypothetical protein
LSSTAGSTRTFAATTPAVMPGVWNPRMTSPALMPVAAVTWETPFAPKLCSAEVIVATDSGVRLTAIVWMNCSNAAGVWVLTCAEEAGPGLTEGMVVNSC